MVLPSWSNAACVAGRNCFKFPMNVETRQKNMPGFQVLRRHLVFRLFREARDGESLHASRRDGNRAALDVAVAGLCPRGRDAEAYEMAVVAGQVKSGAGEFAIPRRVCDIAIRREH